MRGNLLFLCYFHGTECFVVNFLNFPFRRSGDTLTGVLKECLGTALVIDTMKDPDCPKVGGDHGLGAEGDWHLLKVFFVSVKKL